jgi:hypothetical protein
MTPQILFRKYWPLFTMLPIWALIYYFVNKSNKDAFSEFYGNDIYGKIIHSEMRNHGFWVAFMLSSSKTYTFAPIKNGSNVAGAKAFMNDFTKGDSIWKGKMSDTLLLIKRDRTLKYTFTKSY